MNSKVLIEDRAYLLCKFLEENIKGTIIERVEPVPKDWLTAVPGKDHVFTSLWPPKSINALEASKSYMSPQSDWVPYRCLSLGVVTHKAGKDTFERAHARIKKIRKGKEGSELDTTDLEGPRKRCVC